MNNDAYALTKAVRALGRARAASMTPAERTESARRAAEARWARKDQTMVTAIRTRLATAEEQRGGAGPLHKIRVSYSLDPTEVRDRLRRAVSDGVGGVTPDDLVNHSSGRLREEALRELYTADELRGRIAKKEPDPTGDALAAEHAREWGTDHILVVRKSFKARPGLGLVAEEDTVVYAVRGGGEAVRQALLKAMGDGRIEPGALAALNVGRLGEGTLLKAFPEARRVGFTLLKAKDLADAAAELDDLCARRIGK